MRLKNFVENLQKKKIGYILIAVAISAILWVYVAQSQNPMTEKLFEIPLEYNNLPSNMAVVDRMDTVKVRIQGYTGVVENIDTKDISASLDLSDANIGQYVSKINIELPAGVQLISVTPVDVEVNIQELVSVDIPVEVDYSAVTAEADYLILTPVTMIDAVKVSGAKDNIEKIDKAVVKIPAGVLNDSYSGNLPVSIYDSSGNSMDELVTVLPETVEVVLPVIEDTPSKVVPISASLVGEPAEGYTISRIIISPNVVSIYGSQHLLDNIDYAKTEAIDITDAKSDVNVNVGLVRDEGIKLDSEEKVNVIVMIEKESTKTFDNVQVKLLNSNSSNRYVLSQDMVSVTVKGPESSIEALSANNISVEADVSGLEKGSNRVKLTYNISGASYVESITPSTITVTVQ